MALLSSLGNVDPGLPWACLSVGHDKQEIGLTYSLSLTVDQVWFSVGMATFTVALLIKLTQLALLSEQCDVSQCLAAFACTAAALLGDTLYLSRNKTSGNKAEGTWTAACTWILFHLYCSCSGNPSNKDETHGISADVVDASIRSILHAWPRQIMRSEN